MSATPKATPYTRVNLGQLEDVAPANGFGERWEARVAWQPLAAKQAGISHFRLRPGKRSPFVHRHRETEEVYLVLSGSGRVKLGEEIRELAPLEAIRVAPATPRGRGDWVR